MVWAVPFISVPAASTRFTVGWHVISEANRIFGFENWDRQTQAPECLWSETQRGQTVCFYSTKVRITVRAGETLTVREGIGTGLGRAPQPEVAHEMAVKAAETDATKRALATFGNPFGLALYDRDHAHVTKPREKLPSPPPRYRSDLVRRHRRAVFVGRDAPSSSVACPIAA
jgi:recombination DNA repair RAD52 pathway protein